MDHYIFYKDHKRGRVTGSFHTKEGIVQVDVNTCSNLLKQYSVKIDLFVRNDTRIIHEIDISFFLQNTFYTSFLFE